MIVGREKEIQELTKVLQSDRPEFVVLYGRRRIGKTFLIDSVYRDSIVFRHAGLPPKKANPRERMKLQLNAFLTSLRRVDAEISVTELSSWMDAFFYLERYLDKLKKDQKHVVFLDELPWMDTTSSNFLDAFHYFWSNYLCFQNHMILVVTGSASSWILENIVNDDRGFYRRDTHEILLKPFTLRETRRLLEENGLHFSPYEVAQIYMAAGGVPFYLNYFLNGESVAQNIDRIFFGVGSKLNDEFEKLFTSQFIYPELCERIVRVLANKSIGLTARELAEAVGLKSSGSFYAVLRALQSSGFLQEYSIFGERARDSYFKLIDPFCYFYLKQVEPHKSDPHYWSKNFSSPSTVSFYGYAFELVCFGHIEQIESALGISGISTRVAPFYQRNNEGSAQIDMVIRRADNVTNLCEAKWSNDEYIMSKTEHLSLERKKTVLSSHLLKRESVHSVLLTTFGLKNSEYFSDFDKVITLDSLFL